MEDKCFKSEVFLITNAGAISIGTCAMPFIMPLPPEIKEDRKPLEFNFTCRVNKKDQLIWISRRRKHTVRRNRYKKWLLKKFNKTVKRLIDEYKCNV